MATVSVSWFMMIVMMLWCPFLILRIPFLSTCFFLMCDEQWLCFMRMLSNCLCLWKVLFLTFLSYSVFPWHITVITGHLEVSVYDQFVMNGNSALLKCHTSNNALRDLIKVISWEREDGLIITSTHFIGKFTVPTDCLYLPFVSLFLWQNRELVLIWRSCCEESIRYSFDQRRREDIREKEEEWESWHHVWYSGKTAQSSPSFSLILFISGVTAFPENKEWERWDDGTKCERCEKRVCVSSITQYNSSRKLDLEQCSVMTSKAEEASTREWISNANVIDLNMNLRASWGCFFLFYKLSFFEGITISFTQALA